MSFLDYVKQCPSEGRLSEDVKPGRHQGLGGSFSTWWARFLDELGLTDKRLTFHSFRHGWKDAAGGARLSEEVHDALTGHQTGSVGRMYGHGVPLPVLAEAVAKINYQEVKLPV